MANEECVLIDEKLEEAVREFPILYDKSLKDSKDRNKKDLAWSDVAKMVEFASGNLQSFCFVVKRVIINPSMFCLSDRERCSKCA